MREFAVAHRPRVDRKMEKRNFKIQLFVFNHETEKYEDVLWIPLGWMTYPEAKLEILRHNNLRQIEVSHYWSVYYELYTGQLLPYEPTDDEIRETYRLLRIALEVGLL